MNQLRDLPIKDLLSRLNDGVYVVDRDRMIRFWNTGAEKLSGYSEQQMMGSHCFDNLLVHVDKSGTNLCQSSCPLSQTMEDGKVRESSIFLHHRSGYRVPVSVKTLPIRNDKGVITGAIEIFSDVTHVTEIRAQRDECQRLAMMDPLTELGNRRFAEENLRAVVNMFIRYEMLFGVLFLDIDHFKNVNDNFGHFVGDQVLKMVAQTLQKNMRSYDVISRWGGEEFVGIIKNIDQDQLAMVANKLRALVEKSHLPFESADSPNLSVTVSIGGTLVRKGDRPEDVVVRADQQMYRAKESGRNKTIVE